MASRFYYCLSRAQQGDGTSAHLLRIFRDRWVDRCIRQGNFDGGRSCAEASSPEDPDLAHCTTRYLPRLQLQRMSSNHRRRQQMRSPTMLSLFGPSRKCGSEKPGAWSPATPSVPAVVGSSCIPQPACAFLKFSLYGTGGSQCPD